jgi:small subunit ribosomal protein S15
MLNTEEKVKIIEKSRVNEKDTGSSDVQIALLSEEITKLLLHLKKHPKDFLSKRGLLKMVSKRRKLLKYLQQENPDRYAEAIKSAGLKK